MGFVYVLAAPGAPKLKIGCSETKTTAKRVRFARHGDPDLDVVAKVRVRDARALEIRVHNVLAAHRWQRGHAWERDHRRPLDWFYRTPEVEQFVSRMRSTTNQDQLEILCARAAGEMRCDLCKLPIPLDAPFDEVRRCGPCADFARSEGERLRAARDVARATRTRESAAIAAEALNAGYLNIEAVVERLRGASKAWIIRSVNEGRLRAVRGSRNAELWFLPEWVDAYVESLAEFTNTAESKGCREGADH
jgi:hypothetical protein